MISARCPICGKRLEAESREALPHWPFCSARCRLIDLGRWLGEEYRVPSDEPSPEGDTGESETGRAIGRLP